jgi:cytochrome c peroxidase
MTGEPAAPRWLLAAAALCWLSACGANDSASGASGGACELCPDVGRFPEMAVPEDNQLTDARIELGRYLFYDRRLSGNGEQACAGCHEQALAFSDGRPRPTGSTGDLIPRNSPSLANVGYLPVYTWVNPMLTSLEQQATVPLFADVLIELGASQQREEILQRLQSDPRYPALFRDAYGERDALSWNNVVRALAAFQRTLISNRAPFDRYLAGDPKAVSEAALRGFDLFNSERLECYHCHAGFNFTTAVRTAWGEAWRDSFVNPGLYNTADPGGYPPDNPGLYEITEKPDDIGRFRIPTLRNVAVTGPYMHDGSLATLDDVLDHYARGGTLTTEGPLAGDGATNPSKHFFLSGFELQAGERADVLAFLDSLTDEELLGDPRYADPFAEGERP